MEEQKQGYTNEIQQANAANEVEQSAPKQMKMSGVVASPPNQIAPVSVNDEGNTSARTAPEADMPKPTEGESENEQTEEPSELDKNNNTDVPPAVSEETGVEEDVETEETEEVEETEETEEKEFAPPLQNYYDEDKVENPLDIANNLLKDAPGRQRFY